MRLIHIHNDVLQILQESERARGDDNFLYLRVCEKRCPDIVGLPFWRVFSEAKANGLVSFESVRRTRQKIQAKYPELKSPKSAQARADKVTEYLSYARADI